MRLARGHAARTIAAMPRRAVALALTALALLAVACDGDDRPPLTVAEYARWACDAVVADYFADYYTVEETEARIRALLNGAPSRIPAVLRQVHDALIALLEEMLDLLDRLPEDQYIGNLLEDALSPDEAERSQRLIDEADAARTALPEDVRDQIECE